MQLLKPKRPRASIITRADRARDARCWHIASDLYRRALDRNPFRADIWVQYGHMLKESGHPVEAERAYRAAIAYKPHVGDSYLHLGHLLKIQGQNREAQAAYLRAFALDPSSAAPLPE